MKILNLYCCLGGNRYKWGDQHEITAVELDPELARMYQERFPNDTVIVGDAHEYLLNHYKEFDFIWSSPPCPTHSKLRLTNTGEGERKSAATYPDMKLYQEIIFLHYFHKGLFCIENVIPYYKPLVPGQQRGRHLFWSNFKLPHIEKRAINVAYEKTSNLCAYHSLSKDLLDSYKGKQRKDKIARNLVDYEAGATILNRAIEIHKSRNISQGVLNFAP